MKKIFVLLLATVMCFSIVACKETTDDDTNKTEKEGTVITVDNLSDYLEFVVETDGSEGFLNYHLYLKAKDGVVISNETNTMVYFSYNMSKQHYTMENNQVVLGTCEAVEETYTDSLAMFRNQSKENYSEELDSINGGSWSFDNEDRWTMIPSNLAIAKIEGTIITK